MMINEMSRKFIAKMPPSLSLQLIALRHFLNDSKRIMASRRKVEEGLKDISGSRELKNTLKSYCLFYNLAGADKYLDSYFEGPKLEVLKYLDDDHSNEKVVLICCVKNDLRKIKELYLHHKDIGIKRMVFLDNGSTDGTKEWLLKQDVDVYQSAERYHAGVKAAWVRKLQEIYGFNRWYLILDSDELFSYIGMEKHLISEFIDRLEEKGIERVQSILLDMYPLHELYQINADMRFVDDYCYFDSESYYSSRDGRGNALRGGPRLRALKNGKDIKSTMSKFPLIYARNCDVWGDHYPMPFEKNFKSPCYGVLQHYKFLEGEFERYQNIVQEGTYYNNSSDYRIYISNGKNIKWYYQGSVKYEDSNSFGALPFVKEIDWGEE